MIWFYTLYSKPVKSQEARDLWTFIVSNIPGITYKRPFGSATASYELLGAAGISNMLNVIGALIPDPGLTHELDSADRINRLCELFSSEANVLWWRNSEEKREIKTNTNHTLTFFMNYNKSFEWQFSLSHFSFRTLVNEERWQNKLSDVLLPLLQEQPSLTFYVSEPSVRALLEAPSPLFLTLAYSHIYDEKGSKAVIRSIFTQKRRDNYGLALTLMKRLPTEDERIKNFIAKCISQDKEWVETPQADVLKNILDLSQASHYGFLNFVKHYIGSGTAKEIKERVNQRLHDNTSPLILAASNGHPKVVKFLVRNGALLEAKDDNDRTALLWAVCGQHSKVVKFLVKNGASLEARDYLGNALIRAEWNRNLVLVKFLVENGINVNRSIKWRESDPSIKHYLTNVLTYLKYPHQFKDPSLNQFTTPHDYYTWAIKTLESPVPGDFTEFPKQAFVIGILETLMGEYFPINVTTLSEKGVEKGTLRAIAIIGSYTKDNALTDQVWLGLKDKLSKKAHLRCLGIYILETYVRLKDKGQILNLISKTKSPLFKDIGVDVREKYTGIIIGKYGNQILEIGA